MRYVIDDSCARPRRSGPPARPGSSAPTTWSPAAPLYADFLGDADELANGNVLVGFGGIGQEIPPARGRIIEVVPTGASGGDIVYDISLPETYTSYRVERLTSLYAGPKWVTDFVPPPVS